MVLISAKVTPSALHLAVVAVLDEFLQGLLGVFRPVGVLVVLDSIYLYSAVVLGAGTEKTPGLRIGLNSIGHPVFVDKEAGVQVGGYGQSGGGHLTRLDEAAAADKVLLAPVAAFAARGEVLDGLAVIDSFLGAVYPAETERNLHSIDIAHYARTIGLSAVYAQPEVAHLVVVVQVPLVELLAGVDV